MTGVSAVIGDVHRLERWPGFVACRVNWSRIASRWEPASFSRAIDDLRYASRGRRH